VLRSRGMMYEQAHQPRDIPSSLQMIRARMLQQLCMNSCTWARFWELTKASAGELQKGLYMDCLIAPCYFWGKTARKLRRAGLW